MLTFWATLHSSWCQRGRSRTDYNDTTTVDYCHSARDDVIMRIITMQL